MQDFRYLSNVTTLSLDKKACAGCGQCVLVCPHGVFEMNEGKAQILDRDGCMECGACVTNCPTEAVHVNPGVGCAFYIVQSWVKGKEKASCGCG